MIVASTCSSYVIVLYYTIFSSYVISGYDLFV